VADSLSSDNNPLVDVPTLSGGATDASPRGMPTADRKTGRRPVTLSPPVAVPPRADSPATWFLSESRGQLEPVRQLHALTDVPKAAVPVATGDAERSTTSAIPRFDLSRLSRWALPILALVAGVETGWILTGLVRTPTSIPVAPVAPAAAAVAVDRPSAPAGLPGELPAQASAGPQVPRAAVAPSPAKLTTPLAVVPTTGSGSSHGAGAAAVPQSAQTGYLSIPMPFQVEVYEGGRFIGLNGGDLAFSGGTHQLQLVNDSLGFRATERVAISVGKTTRLSVAIPTALVQLNAVPWAEVTIDGASAGDTPLGNVPLTLGAHTIVFRHPQLGEETRRVVVSAQAPTRVSVDLTK